MKLTIYTKSVLQLLAIAVALYLTYLVRYLVVYLILAAVISLVAKPITNRISRLKIGKRNFPRALAAFLTLLLLLGIFGLLNYLIIPEIVAEIGVLSRIDFHEVIVGLETEYSALKEFLAGLDIDFKEEENSIRSTIISFLNVNTLTTAFGGIMGGLGNLAIASFSILFILFFFLKEKELTHNMLVNAIPDRFLEGTENMLPKIKHTLGRYFRGLLMQMTGIFTLVFLGLKFIAGVEDALVIALFAAFANLIPYIGPIFGMVFGLIVGVGQAYAIGMDVHFGLLAAKILLVFAITQLTDNMVFQPVIFSNSINAHPLEIFIVIMVAGTLFGATGMIIAIPTYSVLRIFSKEFLQGSKVIRNLTRNV